MKRRLLPLFLALFAAVLLWALFGSGKHQVKLPDGTTVTLHAVTAGLSNRYCFGNTAQRVAAKLPWPWAQKFAANSLLTVPPDRDTNLVVWVTYRGNAPKAGRTRFRCIHEGGTNELAFSGITKYGLPSGEAATAFYTAIWPRRSKRFTLQAHDADTPSGKEVLWKICVPNPLRADYPQWQPEVLPGRRSVGDLSFILEEIVPSESRPVSTATWLSIEAETLQARLRVTLDGQPNDDWEICGVRFRDALGNLTQFRQLKTRNNGGNHDIDFAMPLLAGDRAGKLGVAFARRREFPANELFTLPEVALPAPGKHINQALQTNTRMGQISLAVLAHNLGSGPEFEVSVLGGQPPGREPSEPGALWFQPLSATDDLGRHYLLTAAADRRDSFNTSYSFRRIRVPRDAKSLVFTVAATPVVFVEFTVGRENITSVR
jgi:hypothetical protein